MLPSLSMNTSFLKGKKLKNSPRIFETENSTEELDLDSSINGLSQGGKRSPFQVPKAINHKFNKGASGSPIKVNDQQSSVSASRSNQKIYVPNFKQATIDHTTNENYGKRETFLSPGKKRRIRKH